MSSASRPIENAVMGLEVIGLDDHGFGPPFRMIVDAYEDGQIIRYTMISDAYEKRPRHEGDLLQAAGDREKGAELDRLDREAAPKLAAIIAELQRNQIRVLYGLEVDAVETLLAVEESRGELEAPEPARSLSVGMIAAAFAATLEPGDVVHSAGGRVWAEVHNGERTVTICEGLEPGHADRFAAMIGAAGIA